MEKPRRQFTPQQKVAILREHLIEQVPVSDLCDKHKLHPTLFYQWQKAFFENGAAAFESRRPRSQSLSREEDKIAALEAKLRSKTEVLAEVVEELVRTKKRAWGELSGGWVAHDIRDNVIDFINRLCARTEISQLRLLDWMGTLAAPSITSGSIATAKPTSTMPSFPVITGSSSGKGMPLSTSTISSRWRAIAGSPTMLDRDLVG